MEEHTGRYNKFYRVARTLSDRQQRGDIAFPLYTTVENGIEVSKPVSPFGFFSEHENNHSYDKTVGINIGSGNEIKYHFSMTNYFIKKEIEGGKGYLNPQKLEQRLIKKKLIFAND